MGYSHFVIYFILIYIPKQRINALKMVEYANV